MKYLYTTLIISFLLVSASISDDTSSLSIGIEEYRQKVSEANHAIASSRIDLEISRIRSRGEWSVFEPALVGDASRGSTQRQNTVEQALSQDTRDFKEDLDRASLGIEGALPLGLRYWVGTSVDRRSNNLTSQWVESPFESEYMGFAGVRLVKPLLRDAGNSSTFAGIRLAEAEVGVQQQAYRRAMMEVVSRAELAYWNLALSQYVLDVRREAVGLAEQLLEDNRKRVEAGQMSEIELLEAKSGLALRRTQERDAQQTLIAAQNMVRTFIAEASPFRATRQLETTDSPDLKELQIEFETAISEALEMHPDYLAQFEVIRQEDIRLAYNRSQRWPQLDLVGSYGMNGLGDSISDSYSKIGHRDHPAWSVGVELRFPLGLGVRERAEYEAAQNRKRQALIDLKSAETQIANALNTAFHRVESTIEMVSNYETVVGFNEALLASETEMLEAGKSDSRRFFQVLEDLGEARINHYRSLVEHRKSWLDWEVAKGGLLWSRNMDEAY